METGTNNRFPIPVDKFVSGGHWKEEGNMSWVDIPRDSEFLCRKSMEIDVDDFPVTVPVCCCKRNTPEGSHVQVFQFSLQIRGHWMFRPIFPNGNRSKHSVPLRKRTIQESPWATSPRKKERDNVELDSETKQHKGIFTIYALFLSRNDYFKQSHFVTL